jgi:hypothetical protein
MEPALDRVLAKVEQTRIAREHNAMPDLFVGPPIDQEGTGQ